MLHVAKGVNEFEKKRELNPDMPKSAACPTGSTLAVNMNRLPDGIRPGGLDYSMLTNSGLTTVTLMKNGVQALLNVESLTLEKPGMLNLTGGGTDDEPASGFVDTADGLSAYVVGTDSLNALILPVKTSGPYEITINGSTNILTVSLINGRKVIRLPAAAGSGIFEIQLHKE